MKGNTMEKLLDVDVTQNDWIHVYAIKHHDGIKYQITLEQKFLDLLAWVEQQKQQHAKEIELRKTNPALANSWDHYQTMLKIVMDDV
jgi:hypothetical protein